MISIFFVSFDLYEHVLATSLEKRKTNFPCLYSWSRLCYHYGISSILLHHQNVLPRNPEISVRWLLKQIWSQWWRGKWKQMGTILLRYQPSVKCNPRTARKSTFNFTEIVNEWKGKRGTVCHYVVMIHILDSLTHSNFN